MEEFTAQIRRAQRGDEQAFGLLVSRFQAMAYSYAYAILNDFHLAQDVVQEAFIEVYLCLPALREPLAFPGWLKRLVTKHCDRLTRRRQLPTVTLDAALGTVSSSPGPAEIAERRELAQRVRTAIRELPEPLRIVTALFYISDYSYQEIAIFLEVSAKTVKSRLHSARSQLRERMIDIVENELKTNALPEEFTRDTVRLAVARASAMNVEHQFDEAEALLRRVLTQLPEHPDALRELNRTLTWGQVYGQARWELLSELARQGRILLHTLDDDYVRHELARTLLAIPSLPEAATFLEEWIASKGSNVERLGMLAWARGSMGNFEAAERAWHEVRSQALPPDQLLAHIPFIAYTLVDCFAAAGDVERAQRIAREAWDQCGRLGLIPSDSPLGGDFGWMTLFRRAELDQTEVTSVLLARLSANEEARTCADALCIRNWVEEPDALLDEWLAWTRERIAAGEWTLLETYRSTSLRGLRGRGNWQAAGRLAQAVWQLLGQVDAPEAARVRTFWNWELFNPMGAIEAEDWEAAAIIAREGVNTLGIRDNAWWSILVAAGQGAPTPPDILQAVEQEHIASADSYGMDGWYAVAREAGAAGDADRAFEALRKALSYWTNPPYARVKIWENDGYWGNLREHSQFRHAFDERRERLGTVYGALHYFPGW